MDNDHYNNKEYNVYNTHIIPTTMEQQVSVMEQSMNE